MGLYGVGSAVGSEERAAQGFDMLVDVLELAAEAGGQHYWVWQPARRRTWFSNSLMAALKPDDAPCWTSPDDLLDAILEEERPAAAALLRLCAAGQRQEWTHAFTMRRHDGSQVKLQCRMASRGDGLFVGAVMIAESELVEARTLLRLMSEGLNDGSWEWDIVADRVTLSPRLCEMLGLEGQSAVIRSAELTELVHPDDRAAMMEAAGRVLAGEISGFRNRLRFRHVDGRYRHILCVGQRLPYPGAPRFVGWHLDVTEAVEREEQLQALAADLRRQTAIAVAASRAKSAFLSSVSHEFRTPLNSILGFAELLGGPSESEVGREYAGYIRQAGYRLTSYVDALLAFVRFDTDTAGLRDETVDAVKAARAVTKAGQAWGGGDALRLRIVGRIPTVHGDPQALHAGLSAMLSAMHDLTGQTGAVDMVVRTTGDGGQVRLRARAAGRGLAAINPADVNNLFPETQVDIPADRQAVGLKFLVARKVAGLFGGACALHVRPGVGMIADMSLPAARRAAAWRQP